MSILARTIGLALAIATIVGIARPPAAAQDLPDPPANTLPDGAAPTAPEKPKPRTGPASVPLPDSGRLAPPVDGTVILTEDFRDMQTGWPVGESPTAVWGYSRGSYVINLRGTGRVRTANDSVVEQGVLVPRAVFRDFCLDFHSSLKSTAFSYVEVRFRVSARGFYTLAYNSRKQFSITRFDGQYRTLLPFRKSESLQANNDFRILFEGDRLLLYANGTPIAVCRDPDPLPPGGLIFLAGLASGRKLVDSTLRLDRLRLYGLPETNGEPTTDTPVIASNSRQMTAPDVDPEASEAPPEESPYAPPTRQNHYSYAEKGKPGPDLPTPANATAANSSTPTPSTARQPPPTGDGSSSLPSMSLAPPPPEPPPSGDLPGPTGGTAPFPSPAGTQAPATPQPPLAPPGPPTSENLASTAMNAGGPSAPTYPSAPDPTAAPTTPAASPSIDTTGRGESAAIPDDPKPKKKATPSPKARPSAVSNAPLPGSDVFPLMTGNYWVFEGVIKNDAPEPGAPPANPNPATASDQPAVSSEAAKRVEVTVRWRMDVMDTAVVDGWGFALVKGYPSDLASYDAAREPSESLIIRDPEGRYYLVQREDITTQLIALQSGNMEQFEKPGPEDLILAPPFTRGSQFGSEQALRREGTTNRWVISGEGSARLPHVRGLTLPAGKAALPTHTLEFRTNPDVTTVQFAPGVGILAYKYVHFGTATECDVRLVECHLRNN
ncbi:hypothetical protein DB346_22385 [Verrucomicrobia bacterium LW23]|nr:hypothetical protein DB346_22385 [Verrucomicrobia bacterium LW23]